MKGALLSFDEFKLYRNNLNRLVKLSKENYFQKAFYSARLNIKNTWNRINNTPGTTKKLKSNSINVNNAVLNQSDEITTAFNNFFISIPSKIRANLPRPSCNFNDAIC